MARLAGSAEAKVSSRHYELPRGPRNVLWYAATTSVHGNLGGPERRGMARILLAIWLDEKSPEKAVLYFSDYDVSVYRGKEKSERYNRKNIVGKSGRFDFDPAGSQMRTTIPARNAAINVVSNRKTEHVGNPAFGPQPLVLSERSERCSCS